MTEQRTRPAPPLTDPHPERGETAGAQKVLDTLMACVPEGITVATAPDVITSMTSRYGDELLLDGWDAGKGL